MHDGYTYGDTELAAERLDLVARAFAPTTRRFLQREGVRGSGLALDLGCGPGNTTRLLAETLSPVRTIGLDASQAFIERARHSAPSGVTFQEHDVRTVPFPQAPADLIYCRLLLSHLPDPPEMVAQWGLQLSEDGLLMLDEMEDIAAEPIITRYLDLTRGVVRRTGAELFVGAALDSMQDPRGLKRVANAIATFTLPQRTAATIFGMNLSVLTERGEVAPQEELSAELAALASSDVEGSTTWQVRQLVFVRS
jgi:trans-aconitate 2-methyltransferase